jgi:trehalose 6-phosphate synthase
MGGAGTEGVSRLARLVVVSNRVMLPTRDGRAQPGGLAVAIRAVLKDSPGTWFGWSGTVASKREEIETRTLDQGALTYVVTDLIDEDFQEYYNGFANRVLWPILHYRLDLAEFSRRDLSGYMRVNAHFAAELAKVLRPDDVVWVHDYHLIPLANALRARGYTNKIGFFLHIPFPPPEILTALPNHEHIVPLLGQYDLVGFQTNNDAVNFARYLAIECRFPQVERFSFRYHDRIVRIGCFPIGIDTAEFNRLAHRSVTSRTVQEVVRSLSGRTMILGVDRLDYSKGIAQRLDAFERFLKAHPEWRGQVTYLQITPKSRSEIQEYGDMERDVSTRAGHINGTYGEAAWTPIRYVNRAYSHSVLAGLYRSARVALVTPLRDGMNLVAKEFIAAQNEQDPGVLILSRFAGAALELRAALLVNPHDAESVGAAIAQALSMPAEERRARYTALYDVIAANDVKNWARGFMASLLGPQSLSAEADPSGALMPK